MTVPDCLSFCSFSSCLPRYSLKKKNKRGNKFVVVSAVEPFLLIGTITSFSEIFKLNLN